MMVDELNKSELTFEKKVIDYLTQIGGTKQWEYRPEIKDSEALWSNFKRILEQNNRGRLDKELSTAEFNQVKRVINQLDTPYKAGQFLYGVNGVSQVEVDLDNGEHVFLTVFDQAQVGGGNTVYQVVNQIERDKVVPGKPNRRFDVTLLINGLPIIQIELKSAMRPANDALNQMEQYIAERQYSGIFSTLQILIAMTPNEIKYMANTTRDKFNKAFAFKWQDEESTKPINNWMEFSDKVLSIPMAHDLSTRYMVLDGTKNKESIKVMRPYQVYATKRVLEKVAQYDFKYDDGRLGYVWHTTGSGKTITSFKTAWLASRLPHVHKVVFLVDRIALTRQTVDAYQAYDPLSRGEGESGVVNDTANVSDLKTKLTRKSDKNIIVTSIQKMARFVSRDSFKPLNHNILFIVDEAHRSTGDGSDTEGMLQSIRKAIPNAAWVGYTGTPRFEGQKTKEVFGSLLHAYTIKHAIADHNVLGFNVEFKETIEPMENPSEEDIDDMIRASVYDTDPVHVELVVQDVLYNWKEKSNNYKYNALFTVHVGGNKPSIPRAMEYFDKFMEENKKLEERPLKIAIIFSADTSNSDSQLQTNESLDRALASYNQMFGTAFDRTTLKAYSEDLARRLNKAADDRNYLDLVIVVDQLLTGFDAPELNTLYVDRTLKGGNLIQAYSRTNRVHDSVAKPWGNIVNYRWPKQNEYEMNKAFAVYSDRHSADEQLDLDELIDGNTKDKIISKPFSVAVNDMKELVDELRDLTDNFDRISPSEEDQVELFEKLKNYNRLMTQLKQYTVDEEGNRVSAYDAPEEFYDRIGMTPEEEIKLTVVIADELKRLMAENEDVDISHIELSMVQINEVRINYDYLVDLIAKMADEIHAHQNEEAEATRIEINVEIAKSDNEEEKEKMRRFVDAIYSGDFVFDSYPAPRTVEAMDRARERAVTKSNTREVAEFVRKWGLDNSTLVKDLLSLIEKHSIGQDDLDKQGEISAILNAARADYQELAEDDIAELSWIKYRNEFRKAIYKLADDIKRGE